MLQSLVSHGTEKMAERPVGNCDSCKARTQSHGILGNTWDYGSLRNRTQLQAQLKVINSDTLESDKSSEQRNFAVTEFCGDGRTGLQLASGPDIGQVLKATGLTGSGGGADLRTVNDITDLCLEKPI
jgi:hypothetical protein